MITGASRGIGLAIAERLVRKGVKVCITARKEPALAETVARLGGDVTFSVAGSACDRDRQLEVIESAIERWGGLDLLVNDTGINPAYEPLLELEESAAKRILGVALLGALGWTRSAWRAGLDSSGGGSGHRDLGGGAAPGCRIGFYGSSKAALIHLTQQLAMELVPSVPVYAVAPAVMRTRFASVPFQGRETEVLAGDPVGRLGEPEDIAAAVAYLGSSDASWNTGQALVLDGGLTLGGAV